VYRDIVAKCYFAGQVRQRCSLVRHAGGDGFISELDSTWKILAYSFQDEPRCEMPHKAVQTYTYIHCKYTVVLGWVPAKEDHSCLCIDYI